MSAENEWISVPPVEVGDGFGVRLPRLLPGRRIRFVRRLDPELEGGERDHQAAEAAGQRSEQSQPATGRVIATENRHESSFQLRSMSHGERRRDGSGARRLRQRDGQQMGCVLRRSGSERDDPLIARLLALDAQVCRRQPDQGMEPVDRTGGLRDDLEQPVAVPDVHELVPEHDPPALLGPARRRCRQKHDRSQRAPGHGRLNPLAGQKRDGRAHPDLATDPVQKPLPLFISKRR